MCAGIDGVLTPDAQPPSSHSSINFTAARMLIILFSVFAMLIQNGDSNCLLDFQKAAQDCSTDFSSASTEAAKMNAGKDRDQKICCGFSKFESCITDAGKKCGDGIAQVMKQTIDGTKSSMNVECTAVTCSGANSVVTVNSVAMYLLLFLGYFFYMNKF